MRRIFSLFWILILVCATTFSQVVTASKSHSLGLHYALNFQTEQISSKFMGRQMPYRIIVPLAYAAPKESAKHYSVIYLLHGLAGHYDNWTNLTKLTEYAAPYKFIIVMPEGGDGWYTDSSTTPGDKYESYIIQELVPEIDKKFRTIPDRDHRIIAGLSMGGYGAIKFGLRYPNLFSFVGSFSGALDGPLRGQNSAFLRPSIISVFGPEGSKTRKDNDVYGMLREMPDDWLKNIPFIYFDCGTEDSFFPINRDFATLLLEKKVPHEFRELPGKHEWPYWDSRVQEFLRLADRGLQ